MLWLILFFILVVIVFGLGFALHALFWVALALFVIWLVGIIIGRARGKGWYL